MRDHSTDRHAVRGRAARLRDLTLARQLVLPEAWDAASARAFEDAGFQAIGTSATGIAAARGVPDGGRLPRHEMLREIALIAGTVALPVSADVGSGYGEAPGDVAGTVHAALEMGAAGVSLDDRLQQSDGLYGAAEQTARIRAARAAADAQSIPLVITARTHALVHGFGATPGQTLGLALSRGRAYRAAGADIVAVTGLIDAHAVATLACQLGGQLAVIATAGGPGTAVLFGAGACQVTMGDNVRLAARSKLYEIAADIARTEGQRALEPVPLELAGV